MIRNSVIFLIVCLVLLSVGVAYAQVISFSDTSRYWPGWRNYTGDDNYDTIGIPNFTGGSAEVVNGRLTNLTFNRQSGSSSIWGALSPGDLFIDLGANQNWDYVVDLTNWTASGKNNPDPAAGNYNLYSINLALNNTTGGYILSGTDNTNGWSGYNIRGNHPVAANMPWQNGGSIYFSGWDIGTGSTTQYSFDLDALPGGGLDFGPSGKFTIGWGVNCANDVVYKTLVVPEPASLSLLGLGLLGIIGLRRKKT